MHYIVTRPVRWGVGPGRRGKHIAGSRPPHRVPVVPTPLSTQGPAVPAPYLVLASVLPWALVRVRPSGV